MAVGRQELADLEVQRIPYLIGSLRAQGLMDRLLQDRSEEERKQLLSRLESEVGNRSRGGNLEALQGLERVSAVLAGLEGAVRRAWGRAEIVHIGARLVFAALVGALAIFLGTTVWDPYENRAAVGLAMIALTAVGIYSDFEARRRAKRDQQSSLFHRWHLIILPFLLLALLAPGNPQDWTLSGFVDGRLFEPEWLATLSSSVKLGLIGGLTAALPGLAFGYFRVRDRSLRRWDEAKSDLELQQARLHPDLDGYKQRIDDVLIQLISDAIHRLERELEVVAPGMWDSRVPEYADELSWRFLTESYDRVVSTPDKEQIVQYVNTLDRSSIGIAGERGAGKTSLMYAIRQEIDPKEMDPNRPEYRRFLTVWISAPTAFKEEEFLLSVLAKVGTRLGVKLTGNSYWPYEGPEEELKQIDRRQRLSQGTTLVGLAVVVITLFLTFLSPLPIEVGVPLSASLAAIVLLLPRALGWLQKNTMPLQFSGQYRETDRKFLYAAKSLLEELWFKHKEVTSSGASVGGLGVEFTGQWSSERSRRPFTLPQLVQLWDDFVEKVATGDNGAFERVVIFLDEVDKIKDTDRIGEFMRILKTLFKPRRLFFIASISEDAFERFQLRAQAKDRRDEFDSSFDRVTKLDLMSYEFTREVLERRIIGDPLPNPFVQLIWALSRGNPRDSLRYARDVLQRYQGKDLSQVACALVQEHYVEPLWERYRITVKEKMDPKDYFQLSEALREFSSGLVGGAPTIGSFEAFDAAIQSEEQKVQTNQSSSETSALTDLKQLVAGLYYAFDLCDIFDTTAEESRYRDLERMGGLLLLREARRGLEEGFADQALLELEKFRSTSGLPPLRMGRETAEKGVAVADGGGQGN